MDRMVPMPAEAVTDPGNTITPTTNYSDILRELQQQQQQAPPTVSDTPIPPPPPPPAPVTTAPSVAAPVYAPLPPLVPSPMALVPSPASATFFMRYRRHIFVALVAFVFMHYGSPALRDVSYIAQNPLVMSLVTAIAIGFMYYLGDVFILVPETIVASHA